MDRKPQDRLTPRASAAPVVEIAVGVNATRLTSIVDNLQSPKQYIVAPYRLVDPAARRVWATCRDARQGLHSAADEVTRAPSKSAREAKDRWASAEALRALGAMSDGGRPSGQLVHATQPARTTFHIEGTHLAVTLAAATSAPMRGNAPGGMLLYLRKSRQLRPDEGRLLAYLVRAAVAQIHGLPLDAVSPARCLVVEPFAQQVHSATPNYKKAEAAIAAACRTIAKMWDGGPGGAGRAA